MIKFTSRNEKYEEVLGLGLSRRNCEKLLDGQPILIKLSELKGGGLTWEGDVLIMGADTEAEIVRDVLAAGVDLSEAKLFGLDETKEQA